MCRKAVLGLPNYLALLSTNSSTLTVYQTGDYMAITNKSKTLSEFFGISIEKLPVGLIKLREFVVKYPTEVYLDEENLCVTWNTEQQVFTLYADLNEDLNTVYKLTVTEFAPTRILFDSGFHTSIEKCLKSSKAGVATLYQTNR